MIILQFGRFNSRRPLTDYHVACLLLTTGCLGKIGSIRFIAGLRN